ncbi:Uncharacterised protein [Salmonella enterica subsp. enterica serovar Bovismorbificans]|uniref:Uncharacterized protein n=1 Tax=Salmonella enterica subsp. enterica serovar Bovismorbificans TaxID=58097 RepID=A0A655BQ09_SALET|nr:Uncharacterised protein [Salmonella enterica subsp. enterica serovar Bovismorbificans]
MCLLAACRRQCARCEAAAGKGLVDMGRVSMGGNHRRFVVLRRVACAQSHRDRRHLRHPAFHLRHALFYRSELRGKYANDRMAFGGFIDSLRVGDILCQYVNRYPLTIKINLLHVLQSP